MLKQIDNQTEVLCQSSKNLTVYSIPVGLHPKDSDRLLDVIIKFLNDECGKTKESIEILNKEMEYVKDIFENPVKPN